MATTRKLKVSLCVILVIILFSFILDACLQLYLASKHLNKLVQQAHQSHHLVFNAEITNWFTAQKSEQQKYWMAQLAERLQSMPVQQIQAPKKVLLYLANRNYLPAQLALAQQNDNQGHTQTAALWYKRAAVKSAYAAYLYANRIKSTDAQSANDYFKRALNQTFIKAHTDSHAEVLQNVQKTGRPLSAKQLLNAQYDYLQHLIRQNAVPEQWLPLLTTLAEKNKGNSQDWLKLYQAHFRPNLQRFKRALTDAVNNADLPCKKPIHLITHQPWDMAALRQATERVLKSDALFSEFCIAQQHWLAANLNRETRWQMSQFARYFIDYQPDNKKSYKQNNLIVLNKFSDTALIQHEIAHWLGFEDEYVLTNPQLQERCSGQNKAMFRLGVNLIAVDSQYYYPTKFELVQSLEKYSTWSQYVNNLQNWIIKTELGYQLKSGVTKQLNTEAIGYYPVETCQGSNRFQAYKPVAKATFMQNYQLAIPKLYKDLYFAAGDITNN
ncbi:hypothetical protein [Catenovulum sediminis]|uniref:hypothetical protein n=1 Tax=Catenovulum sediminis TaxID=1740262 RepID=UPI001180B0DF|nr:hypothetical protein [Catenovulum sediminis]